MAATHKSRRAFVFLLAVSASAFVGCSKPTKDAEQEARATNQTVVPNAAKRNIETSAASETPEEAASNTVADEEWASAQDAVQQGEIRVRIGRVWVGKIPFESYGDKATSTDELLAITVELENTGATKKIDYHSWASSKMADLDGGLVLTDNFGNNYRTRGFGLGSRAEGGSRIVESIYPGNSASDVLTFEAPVDKFEYLRLELPAISFGGEGVLRIQIPREIITK